MFPDIPCSKVQVENNPYLENIIKHDKLPIKESKVSTALP